MTSQKLTHYTWLGLGQ